MGIHVDSETGPWAVVPLWLVEALAGGACSALQVWIALHHWADKERECWPSHAALAERTGLSNSTVRAALTRLREVGAITWTQRRSDDGDLTSNRYRLLYSHPSRRRYADSSADRSADPSANGYADSSARNQNNVELELLEPDSVTLPTGDITTTRFDAFWSEYPKKVGKQAARKAWDRAVRKVSGQFILDALRARAQWWRHSATERQFIPDPSRWLNEGRWDDELGPPDRNRRPGERPSIVAQVARIEQWLDNGPDQASLPG